MPSNRTLISRVLLVIAAILLVPAVWIMFTQAAYNPAANILSIASSLILIVACSLQWSGRKAE